MLVGHVKKRIERLCSQAHVRICGLPPLVRSKRRCSTSPEKNCVASTRYTCEAIGIPAEGAARRSSAAESRSQEPKASSGWRGSLLRLTWRIDGKLMQAQSVCLTNLSEAWSSRHCAGKRTRDEVRASLVLDLQPRRTHAKPVSLPWPNGVAMTVATHFRKGIQPFSRTRRTWVVTSTHG